MSFNHIGIPATARFEGEIDIPCLQVTVSDHQSNRFGIQWMRYWPTALLQFGEERVRFSSGTSGRV